MVFGYGSTKLKTTYLLVCLAKRSLLERFSHVLPSLRQKVGCVSAPPPVPSLITEDDHFSRGRLDNNHAGPEHEVHPAP